MVNRQHFTALIEPHLSPLYHQAWRLCGNKADAEDLIQDLLIKLYPRMDEMAGIDKLRPWLARILYRQFIDFKRRQARSPLYLAVDNSTEDSDQPLDEQACSGPDPAQSLELSIDQQHLLQAVNQLSDEHRLVLTLHDMEGYSLPELSEIIDCPLGTLKSRLHRARAKLRTALNRE